MKCLPEGTQMLDMKLPLRMDRMHAKERSELLSIACPRKLNGDEEDLQVAYPNPYPQT